MDENKKTMWQFPWKYKESLAVVLGVFVVGVMLQFLLGNFNFYLLHAPTNMILGGILVLLAVALSFAKENPLVRWLTSVQLSVTLIGVILLMTLFMGIIPQVARVNTNLHIHFEQASIEEIANYVLTRMGLKQVTSSWPFVLIYNLTLFVLALVTIKRLHHFKWKDYGFYLNHFGLWLFLFAAGYGASDLLRYVMYVNEGEVEWRVYDANENVLELDLAIKLHDFTMEEYPPRLAILDKNTGDVQPENKPYYYQIGDEKTEITISKWKLEAREYIHEAVRKTDTSFQSIPMTGSVPAIDVKVTNLETNESVEGWVTCGGISQHMMTLDLDSIYAVVMTKPEPKRYASDITVMTKDEADEPIHATIEVNKPLTVGHWTIYQYDYDHAMGKASQVSGFELVYDPWVRYVYAGMFLLALGSISMLWVGNKKKKA